MPEGLVLNFLPEGRVRDAEDAAQVLDEIARRFDAFSVLAELRIQPPPLMLLDLSHLCEALAEFMREWEPFDWETDLPEHGAELAALVAETSRQMTGQPEDVVGLFAKTVAPIARDLPQACRGRRTR